MTKTVVRDALVISVCIAVVGSIALVVLTAMLLDSLSSFLQHMK